MNINRVMFVPRAAAAAILFLAGSSAYADTVMRVREGDMSCDRACLNGFVDKYLNAMAAHDPSRLPLAKNVRMTENTVQMPLTDGLWFTTTAIGNNKHYVADVYAQQAGAIALKQPQAYYDKLATTYAEKRARLLKILTASGFKVYKPRGAYYIMTDISRFPDPDPKRFPATTRDVRFSKFLVEEIGVATVPGSSFYNDPNDGATQIRFTFCKKEETLAAAEQRLAKLATSKM